MNRRDVLTLALVALMLVPAASAYAPGASSSPDAGASVPQSNQSTSTPAADGGDPASQNGGPAVQENETETENYTRLYIEDGYLHGEVKPGQSTTINVTVGNSDDSEVELNPHVVLPRFQGRPLKESWITIEDADTTLAPDEEREFTITVAVPEDADLGSYSAQVAFTNQTVSYQGSPERPVHAARINVDVAQEPAVKVHDRYFSYARIQTGDSYTYEITVENTADEAVPLNPRIQTRDSIRRSENTVDRSWFEIESPNEIGAGETVNVSITVSPPADASIGDYGTEVDLGLQDPNRPDRSDYWQRVHLGFQVWEQPDEPFETSFAVSEDATDVTLTLQSYDTRESASDEPVSFDVTFVAPNGTEFPAERVTVTDSGSVDLAGGDRRGGEQQGPYTSRNGDKELTYRVDDPEAGTWSVKIMPENTIEFNYEIVRNETDENEDA